MDEFSYLHIALRGELKNDTRTLYEYGRTDDGIDPQWDRNMVEPGAAMSRFLNASDCYVMQSVSGKGHYFSLICQDNSAQGREYKMICILVDNGCSLTGRQLNNVFINLKRTLIDEEQLDDAAVCQALREAEVPEQPVRLNSWRVTPVPEGTKLSEAAYRTYISQSDLETIFSFPAQPDYVPYRCVLVVSATTSLRPGVKMPRITTPIRRLYSVVCPDGVKVSAEQVYDGDTLTIKYEREGFTTHTEEVTVGSPSAFTKYEGSKVLVRTATQTGIRFVRRVPLKIVSAKGPDVTGYTLTVNGHFLPTVEPVIEFSEKDLTTDPEVEISVSSTNFRTLKVKKPVEELLTTDLLVFTLDPVEQGFTLRLDFGDGRVFEEQISLERNDPEYTRLRSGYFHGFRAMRQENDENTEVYNIDVRAAKSHGGVASLLGKNKAAAQKAPVFENVSDDKKEEERPTIDTTLPTVDTSTPDPDIRPEYDDDYDDDDTDSSSGKNRGKIIRWAAIALGVIAVVCGAALFLPRGVEFDVTPAEGTSVGASDTPDAGGALTAVPLTPEEQADVDYLNSNPVWKVDSVKTPSAKALMEAIAAGDIQGVANNDYFTVAGRCTNEKANRMADFVWRALGSASEKGNRRSLRSAIRNGEIDLHNLNESLARVRPADNANSAPRPKK
ncbi:MAG: hypothetical protein K2K55_08190 [Duncaniella sp.]|nr:hypothetical protein [Duncaniella sp.]